MVGRQVQQPRCAGPVPGEVGRAAGPVRVGDPRHRASSGVVGGEQQVIDADNTLDVDQAVEDVRHAQLAPELGIAGPLRREEAVHQLRTVEDRLDGRTGGAQLVKREELDGRIKVTLDLVPDPGLNEVDVGGGLDFDISAHGDLCDPDELYPGEVLVEIAVRPDHRGRRADRRVDDRQLAAVWIDEALGRRVTEPGEQLRHRRLTPDGAVSEQPHRGVPDGDRGAVREFDPVVDVEGLEPVVAQLGIVHRDRARRRAMWAGNAERELVLVPCQPLSFIPAG